MQKDFLKEAVALATALIIVLVAALVAFTQTDRVNAQSRVLLLGSTQPLRSAVSRALVGQAFVSGLGGTSVQGQSRTRMYLGGAPLTELRVCYGNWGGAGETVGPGNLVIEAAIESDSPIGVARFLWSGATTVTIAPGTTACSDPIFPAAFGLTTFPANTPEWFRTGATAINNNGFPFGNTALGEPGEGAWAGPAFTSQVNTTGPMTTPSGGATASSMVSPFAVLGRYTVPMPTLCDIGDSISAGVADTSISQINGKLAGNGYVGRSAYGSFATNVYPTFKLGIGGDAAGNSYTNRSIFFQYCTHGLTGWGVNDIEGLSVAAVFANLKTAWSAMHAAGVQYIFSALVTPKSTSTDAYLTEGNQTYFDANFIPGGPKDQLNALEVASIGSNFLNGTVNVGGQMGGIDPDKWRSDVSVPLTTYTSNVTVTSGTKAFSFSSGTFTATDIGKTVSIAGAGTAGALYVDVIAAVGSTTSITTTTNNAGTSLVAAAEAVNYGFPATGDGIHPLTAGHISIAPLLMTALQSVGPQLPSLNTSWRPTGSDWAWDIKNGRWFGMDPWVNVAYPSIGSNQGTTRTSVGYGVTANNSAGALIQFAPNTARVTPGRGLLAEQTTTNLFANPFVPATQTVTVTNATQYTASMTGPGSIVLSGACTGAVSAGSPVTCTTSTTSLTATVSGLPTSMQVELGATATTPINGTRSAEDVGFPQALVNSSAGVAGTIILAVEGIPNNVPILNAFGAKYINMPTTTTIENNATATLTATLGGSTNGHTVVGLTWDGAGRGLDGNGGTIASDVNAAGFTNSSQIYIGGKGSGGGDSTLNNYVQIITHYPIRLTGATSPTFQQATTP